MRSQASNWGARRKKISIDDFEGIELFQGVKSDTKAKVLKCATINVGVRDYEVYGHTGTRNTSIYIVLSGGFHVQYKLGQKLKTLAVFRRGGVFGIIENLTDFTFEPVDQEERYNNAGIVTVIDEGSESIVIPWKSLDKLIASDVNLMRNFMGILTRRLLSVYLRDFSRHVGAESLRLYLRALAGLETYDANETSDIEIKRLGTFDEFLSHLDIKKARYYQIMKTLEEQNLAKKTKDGFIVNRKWLIQGMSSVPNDNKKPL